MQAKPAAHRNEDDFAARAFTESVVRNQCKLASELKSHYDFIVCGAGSSGSVVARRLAENTDVHVLLLEAGDNDEIPAVMEPSLWNTNRGGERDWAFSAEPNPALHGRTLTMSMGRVLGGGSSINALAWVRGHKDDWDFFAAGSRRRGLELRSRAEPLSPH